MPGTTFRFVMYSVTVAVTSGFSVTTETLWPQHQYVETLTLRDTVDGGTLATIHGTVSAHVGLLAGPSLLGARVQLIADRHLRRAAAWNPGDPHISSAIPYDPSDPLSG
ncbi:MAG: hypothetical protein ACT4QG_22085 [Sporichthyaceae bacterium]